MARSLEDEYPGAAASLPEGLNETLTVLRLGLTAPLQRTLRTTNIIENLNSGVERYTHNVKRWRGGQMIQRWVASALLETEQRFRRVRGYRDMRHLVAVLDALPLPDVGVEQVTQCRFVNSRNGVRHLRNPPTSGTSPSARASRLKAPIDDDSIEQIRQHAVCDIKLEISILTSQYAEI